MKRNFIIIILLLSGIQLYSQQYLDLPLWQLKNLGIFCSKDGIFYKNQIKTESKASELLCFYLTDDNYCTHISLKPAEAFDPKTPQQLKTMQTTLYKFQPVMITSDDGHATWDAYTYFFTKGTRLVPVRINMSDLQMKKRKDWIIFWFPPTPELQQALEGIAKSDDHLMDPASLGK